MFAGKSQLKSHQIIICGVWTMLTLLKSHEISMFVG